MPVTLRCKTHGIIVEVDGVNRKITLPAGGLQSGAACCVAEAMAPQTGKNRPRDGSERSCEAEEVLTHGRG